MPRVDEMAGRWNQVRDIGVFIEPFGKACGLSDLGELLGSHRAPMQVPSKGQMQQDHVTAAHIVFGAVDFVEVFYDE